MRGHVPVHQHQINGAVLQHCIDRLLAVASTRVLPASGWHPRHIAGLIRSKYERDYGWGLKWLVYDACSRVEFYVRLFAGLVAAGRDDLVDMNNQSQKEKGYCFREECGYNLQDWRSSLLARRDHERLGGRPFNRLFLPNEHL